MAVAATVATERTTAMTKTMGMAKASTMAMATTTTATITKSDDGESYSDDRFRIGQSNAGKSTRIATSTT